jgi:hypothetical protein
VEDENVVCIRENIVPENDASKMYFFLQNLAMEQSALMKD